MFIDKKIRSVVKAFSWRAIATLTTMTIVYVVTGKLDFAAMVGGFDVVIKMLFYYLHERAWNQTHWGRIQVKPFVLWFTGLPGAGKSTLAQAITDELSEMKVNFERLDGDAVRHIFPKTGYSKEERNTHIQRIGFLASLLEKKGVAVVSAFISPYKDARIFLRDIIEDFIEVYVDAPLEVCEQRDPKGLYQRARAGEIKQFTGVDDPYEVPENPEIIVDTVHNNVDQCKKQIMDYLYAKKYIS